MIKGLSHNVNLGISFMMEHNLKINCTEEDNRPNASKRWVNIKSSVGRRMISKLYKQEDRKSVENY